MELKANPNRAAQGAVIEARLDKGRGPVATLLVQNGTLHQGDVIIAGTAVGRVRAMTDDKGRNDQRCRPLRARGDHRLWARSPAPATTSTPWPTSAWPASWWSSASTENRSAAKLRQQKVTLDNLFAQIQEGEMKELTIIVKADVQGSAEAVKASLEKLSNEEVRVRVIHGAVGAINESDVMLASTSNAIIVGFNVRPDANAKDTAARSKVDMRMYRVIYDCINEMEAAMKGMLAPKFQEVSLGACRGPRGLQDHRRGHHRRLLYHRGQGAAQRPDPPGAGRHRYPRGRPSPPCSASRTPSRKWPRATSAASALRSTATSRSVT